MPFADVNGTRLYYEESGEGEPLICVMGLGTDHLGWAMQRRDFAAQFRTVVFDNRDVGQSDLATGPYTLEDLAQDTLALADHLGIERFHLLGLSMGGAIAQHVAVAEPGRLLSLTVAVTWAGNGVAGRMRGDMLGRMAETFSPDEFLNAMLVLTMSEGWFENPAQIEWLKTAMLNNPHPQPPEAFARQAAVSRTHDLRGRLKDLPMPCHVVIAEHDAQVPTWKQQELHAELPDGTRKTVIEGAAHAMNLERFADFNAAVLDGLAAMRPASA
jgi:pimeloyl-ACP methyl ester carboxylesterase